MFNVTKIKTPSKSTWEQSNYFFNLRIDKKCVRELGIEFE